MITLSEKEITASMREIFRQKRPRYDVQITTTGAPWKSIKVKARKPHCHQNRKRPLPTMAQLCQKFAYDPDTGIIRTKRGPVGFNNGYGYLSVWFSNKPDLQIPVHRVAFALMKGYWPHLIDHINGDKADNRWANLREVSNSENMLFARINNPSNQNVRYQPKRKCWLVTFNKHRKSKNVFFRHEHLAHNFNRKIILGLLQYGSCFQPDIPPRFVRLPK